MSVVRQPGKLHIRCDQCGRTQSAHIGTALAHWYVTRKGPPGWSVRHDYANNRHDTCDECRKGRQHG